MRKALKVLIGIAAVLIIVLAIIFTLPSLLPKEEIIDTNLKNTEIYFGLLDLGLKDVIVDATEERILIRYEDTANIKIVDIAKIAAGTFPESKSIVIQRFENFEPKEQADIKMADAISLLNETLSEEEFLNKSFIMLLAEDP